MKRVVLDTNVASFLHGESSQVVPYESAIRSRSNAVEISFQTVAEMLEGGQRKGFGGKRWRALLRFLDDIDVVPYSLDLAHEYARVRDLSRRQGRELLVADAWVAATAIHRKAQLLTHDTDFEVDPTRNEEGYETLWPRIPLMFFRLPRKGLEPLCPLQALGPQPSASANSATSAERRLLATGAEITTGDALRKEVASGEFLGALSPFLDVNGSIARAERRTSREPVAEPRALSFLLDFSSGAVADPVSPDPIELVRHLLAVAAVVADPRPLIQAARALLDQARSPAPSAPTATPDERMGTRTLASEPPPRPSAPSTAPSGQAAPGERTGEGEER